MSNTLDVCTENEIANRTHLNENVYDINNLLVTAFKDHNVTIYGTWEEPLFRAKDIGDMLVL